MNESSRHDDNCSQLIAENSIHQQPRLQTSLLKMTRQKPHVAREHESVLADMAQLSSALQEQSCAYKNTFFFCVYFSLSALQRISQIHSVRLDSVIHIATSASFWDLLRIISDACTRLPFLPLSLSNVNWLCPLLSLSAPKRPCSWIAKV